ncbi:hypothetical protein TYRP_009199, partial [Tyrophagus putrescentiae]
TYFLANIISISFVSILTKQLFLKINSPKKSRTLSLNVTRRKTLSISRSLSATNNNKFHHTLPHRQDSSSSKALIHLKTFFFQKMSHPPDLKQMLKAIGEALVLLEKTPEVKATDPNLSSVCESVPLLKQTNEFKAINPNFPNTCKLPFNLTSSSSQNSVDKNPKNYSFDQNNLLSDNTLSQSFSPSFHTSNPEMHPESFVSEKIESNSVNYHAQVFPKWIVKVHVEDQFKNFFFNCSQFDLKLLLGNSPFLTWYEEKLDTSNWKDFNTNISFLADFCVLQLETFYSTKQKPKQTRMMHSTERHDLSAVIAFQLPKLVHKYTEFQFQHKQENINCSQINTSTNCSTFMDFFFYKLSRRLDYSYKGKNDQNREEVPLRKPFVSQAMKRNKKDHTQNAKKMKPK